MFSPAVLRWLIDRAARLVLAMLLSLAVAGGLHAEEPPTGNAEGDNTADASPPPALDPTHAARFKAGLELFETQVRDILIDRCLYCHGGDTIESHFNLATREGLLKGGVTGAAVKVGEAQRSWLYKLITHAEEPHMPQDDDRLSADEIAAIARWIDLGAPYDKPLVEAAEPEDPTAWTRRVLPPAARDYWAFRPLRETSPPEVKDAAWPRTPIDHFVAAAHDERGLRPAPPAERRTLIRRAYLDLLGLTPPADEVAAFVADPAADAYERLLDRLLDSPHYGERWGRHWLDAARFAESHGFEHDYDRPHAYHYRDFVIEALNQDMPYDQFVRWQLAGDELAPDERLAWMATGFLGAGVFPTQITKNEVERTRYDALDDMVATVGSAMLGLSVGCARCHEHKFDPIPQADYFRLAAVFTTTVRSIVELDFDPAGTQAAQARWQAEQAPREAALAKFVREQLPARLAAWEAAGGPATLTAAAWQTLELTSYRSEGGATLTPQPDGSLLASGANPDFDTYHFTAETSLERLTGVRLEALAHESFVKGGPGRAANGNIALTDFRVAIEPRDGSAPPQTLQLTAAKWTFQQPRLDAAFAVDNDKKSAWAVDPKFGEDHAVAFEIADAPHFPGGAKLTFTLEFKNNNKHSIGRPRLALSSAAPPLPLEGEGTPREVLDLLARPAAERTPAEQQQLLAWYAPRDEEWRRLRAAVDEHLAARPQAKLAKVMVASEGLTPIRHHTQGADFFPETYFLRRGEADHKVGVAAPGYLQVLTTAPDGFDRWRREPPTGARSSFRRAALADWIVDTEHGAGQLLARVIVNRVWQHHFGRGLVATPNDFGKQADPPTHPELLDWLARELIADGWRLKSLHKRLMTSAAYRQSSRFDEANARIDPENTWLWRWSPRRVEAEIVRDMMLAASGELDRRQFGPGTLDPKHRRRSIYFTVKRSQQVSMMQLLDQPESLVSIGARPSTTIAPQALLFMNNDQVRQYARALGARLAAERSEVDDAIRRAYLTCLAREPADEELAEVRAFVAEHETQYREQGRGDARSLALANVCQVLLSMNEFVYID